jgi:TolB-like protein
VITVTLPLAISLQKRLNAASRRSAIVGDVLEFRFGEFEIDITRHELRQDGALVPIEPQVFDLIVYLVRNHNRIVSKNELIEAIWQGRIVSDASLSSRISTARRVIGDTGVDQKFIRTHHRRGFRFVGRVEISGPPTPVDPSDQAAAATTVPSSVVPLVRQRSGMPSVAVLPFQNISGDPAQEFLADGLTEDIITGLSHQRWFSVVARNSSFAFKGEVIDIRKVSSELEVDYILEGSVRAAGDRVRVTAQLIEARKRTHIWANRHDGQFAGTFDRQDEITQRVVDSVKSQIVMAEAAQARRTLAQNPGVPDLILQALPHMWRMRTQEQRLAQALLEQAIALDPEHAHAQALLGLTYVNLFNLDPHAPMSELTEKALASGDRALSIDDADPWGHLVLGLGYARRRRSDDAMRHLSRSIELDSNFALGHAGLAYALACGGQPERGLQSLERASVLGPLDPFIAMYGPVARYMALFALKDYEETVKVCRTMAARHPNHAGARRLLTVSLGLLDRIDEAHECLAETLTLHPDFSSDHVENNTVYTNPSDRNRFLRGLQKAGTSD